MKKNLSFNSLGGYGRLGNQMFQYAAVYSAAKTLGMSPTANLSSSTIKDCFVLGGVEDKVVQPDAIYKESDFAYDGILKTVPNDMNIDVVGYFQSEKNFLEHKTQIKGQFEFKDEVRESALEKLPDGVLVSVHVRRGDYVQLSETHTNQGEKYYKEAIERFKDHRPVVFSDDIEWCKNEMKWLDNDPVFMDNDQYADLCLMSNCNTHIIANSSFSWWAAWLSGGQTVAPKKWFGQQGPENWSDIYCEGWETLGD